MLVYQRMRMKMGMKLEMDKHAEVPRQQADCNITDSLKTITKTKFN